MDHQALPQLERSRPAMYPSSQRCVICAGPLTVHEAARRSVCSRPECQRQLAVRDATQLAHERYLRRRERARRAARAVDPNDGADVLLVPVTSPALAPLPPARRRRFARRLIAAIRQLWSEPAVAATPGQGTAARSSDPSDARLVAAACATCRGRCCRLGADHGFIDIEVLRRQRAADPGVSARELLARYVNLAPAQVYEGSCVFHGSSGCALPRTMRSATCEKYLCPDLRYAFATTPDVATRPVWVAAMDDDDEAPVRLLRYDAGSL